MLKIRLKHNWVQIAAIIFFISLYIGAVTVEKLLKTDVVCNSTSEENLFNCFIVDGQF